MSNDDFRMPEEIAAEQAEKAKNAALRRKVTIEDIRWLMGGKRGRRIMHGWLVDAGVFRSVFSTNGLTMAYQEGMRQWGLNLLNRIMEASPANWALMMEENSDEAEAP